MVHVNGDIAPRLDSLNCRSYDIYWGTVRISAQAALFNLFRALLTSISTTFISFMVLANAGMISITALLKLL